MTNPKDKQSNNGDDFSRRREASSDSTPPSIDPGFEGQMEAAREGMSRYRNTLKELAK